MVHTFNILGIVLQKKTHLIPVSGKGCSKLMTLLVNVSLKFQMFISQICQYFFLKKNVRLQKLFSFFSRKNISVLVIKS